MLPSHLPEQPPPGTAAPCSELRILSHQSLRRAEVVVPENLIDALAVDGQRLVVQLLRSELGHALHHVGDVVALVVLLLDYFRHLARLRVLVGRVEGHEQAVTLLPHRVEPRQFRLHLSNSPVKRLRGQVIERHRIRM